jgi:hypothetical protein
MIVGAIVVVEGDDDDDDDDDDVVVVSKWNIKSIWRIEEVYVVGS